LIVGTTVDAVWRAVLIGVIIRCTTTADAGVCLIWIVGTTVVAVIGISHTTAALAGFCLIWIVGTTVVAVWRAVLIGVIIRCTTAANARGHLVGVRGT
jgi:hypothetical protein